MFRIDRNNWDVKENEFSIALMRFYVDFDVSNINCIPLNVYVDGKRTLTFNFYAVEDAFSFTEEVISECLTTEDIVARYQEMFQQDMFTLPKGMKKEENEKITLGLEEVDQAIFDCFGAGKNYRVSVKEELTLVDNQLDIHFCLIEHLDYDGIKKDIKTYLTEGDLKRAFGKYVEFYGYELIEFKYIGGIHRVGYFIDEDTPHFDGVELSVKKKEKGKELKKGNGQKK